MNKFLAILYDSYLEIKDRKIFYLYLAVTLIMILIFSLLPGSLNINGEHIMDSGLIDQATIDRVVAGFFDQFFGFMIFIMVFGTAGLLPSYLSKGRVELVVSKPIERFRLILMKFISIYLVSCLILIVTTSLIWLAMSLRLGSITTNFFYGLLLALVQFFIVYAIIFILGLLFNSGAGAIIGYFILRVGSDLLSHREVVYDFLGESVWKFILDTAYNILPKLGEMSDNYNSLMRGRGLGDSYALWSSLLFGGTMILLGLIYFNRKDY